MFNNCYDAGIKWVLWSIVLVLRMDLPCWNGVIEILTDDHQTCLILEKYNTEHSHTHTTLESMWSEGICDLWCRTGNIPSFSGLALKTILDWEGVKLTSLHITLEQYVCRSTTPIDYSILPCNWHPQEEPIMSLFFPVSNFSLPHRHTCTFAKMRALMTMKVSHFQWKKYHRY